MDSPAAGQSTAASPATAPPTRQVDVTTGPLTDPAAVDPETAEEYGLRPPGPSPGAEDLTGVRPRPVSDLVAMPGVVRPLVRLSGPVFIQQLLTMTVGLTDTFLAGQFLEEAHVAAIGVLAYLLWMIPCAFSLVGVGTTAIIARLVGAGDIAEAGRVANQSLTAGTAVTAGLMVALFLFAPSLLAAMGLAGTAYDAAWGYLVLLTVFLPAMMVEQIGMACLRGAGDTLSGLIAMTVVNVINAVLGVLLVADVGPLPALGWLGLAIGTVAGYLAGAVMLTVLLVQGRAGLTWRPAAMRPDLPVIRRILRVGVPGGMDMLALVSCQFLFLAMVGQLGQLALAAHSLAIRIESLAYLPGTAFQVAASTMTGQYLGAGQPHRAIRSVWLAAALCGAFVTAMGGLFLAAPEALTRAFTSGPTAAAGETAADLLAIIAWALPVMGVGMVCSGGLRGAGDVRWPMLFTFFGFLAVRIPLAGYLAWDEVTLSGTDWSVTGLGWGIAGAWWAMVIDLYVRCGLTIGRFVQGRWQREVV